MLQPGNKGSSLKRCIRKEGSYRKVRLNLEKTYLIEKKWHRSLRAETGENVGSYHDMSENKGVIEMQVKSLTPPLIESKGDKSFGG